jgi:hypothetical protein
MAEYTSIWRIMGYFYIMLCAVLLISPLYNYIIYNDSDASLKCLIGNTLAFITSIAISVLVICLLGRCSMFRNSDPMYRADYFTWADLFTTLATLVMGGGYVQGIYDTPTYDKCVISNAVSWATFIVVSISFHLYKYCKRNVQYNTIHLETL